jgi:hypothetical protein
LSDWQQKELFIRHQSVAKLDQFFKLRPITDVSREGADVLYLQGVTSEALYTSYHDLLEVMPWLYAQGVRTWCDVGCGVGRTCLLWTWLFSDTKSFGIEMVPERLEEARGATRAQSPARNLWIEADFSSPSIQLPDADVYFIYLATGPQLDTVLAKLKSRAHPSWVVVVESHGDLKPRLQWEAWWLAPTAHRFALVSHRHDPWIQIYRTRPDHPVLSLEEAWEGRLGLMPADLAIHPSPLGYLLSKSRQLNWELVIEEEGELWTMETLGLSWHDPQSIAGLHPPRQINWSRVKVGLRRIPDELPYREWALWRRQDKMLRYSRDGIAVKSGLKIRKIILNPTPLVEFSDGLRVEWDRLSNLEVDS